MSDKTESANLILKLYELRRDDIMRKARNWYLSEFHPASAQDVSNAVMNTETSAYYRMVTSYWEMACSFVANGAIDEQMFNDANGEHMAVFAKIEPFVAELRETYNNPTALQHLERVVMGIPDARERMARFREMVKQVMAARAQAAQQQ
jgi:DNA primase large subunit